MESRRNWRGRRWGLLIAAWLLTPGGLPAADWFVNKQGNDAYSGQTREEAFLTIQRGVDALTPGDVLHIGPGEYRETAARKDLGSAEVETVIRAEIPGTVVLRGDVPAPEFQPSDFSPHVFVGDFVGEVHGVNEVDTLQRLVGVVTAPEAGFTSGSFFHDADAGKLYISPTDLRPADRHQYTVVTAGIHGLWLQAPRRVVVDGLAATGFNSLSPLRDWRPQFVVWGIFLDGASNCVVRNCTAYLNGAGILVLTADADGHNLIESCVGYGNGATHNSEGGNVSVFNPKHDVIRDCVGYRSGGTGVRIYGGGIGGAIENSLGWGNTGPDLGIKGGEDGVVRRSTGLGILPAFNLEHCLIGKRPLYIQPQDVPKDTVLLEIERLAPDHEFADPVNFDFRLQSSSSLRGAAPDGSDRGPHPFQANIFFVRPDGDDQADGLSVASAWQTAQHALTRLRPGDTLYFEAGSYAGPLTLTVGEPGAPPVSLRGRGTGPVIFSAPFEIRETHGAHFERLNFLHGATVTGSSAIGFDNCRFAGGRDALGADGVSALRITHCEFSGFEGAGIGMHDCAEVFLASNLFANAPGSAGIRAGEVPPTGWRALWRGLLEKLGIRSPEARQPEAVVSYSDYNSYAQPESAWIIDGRAMPLARVQESREAHSRPLPANLAPGDDGVPRPSNPVLFLGQGALGRNIGFHQDVQGNYLYMTAPKVHSVTATTANIEWLVSRGADCVVAWGETPECENERKFTIATIGDRHRTFSLTGLKPATKYYFQIRDVRMLAYPDYGPHELVDPQYETISFTTLETDPPPRTLYVSPEGNDANSGLARGEAWRTVTHAAGAAAPGDTVMVLGGTYPERVRVRATGEEGRPITFRSAPGEKVVFDGVNQRLDNAWTINGKSHIVVDGFYFYRHIGEPGGNVSTRLFNVVESDTILIRRCFLDGRKAGGYPASFLTAWTTPNLTLSNCVSILAPDGVEVSACPDFRIENCVFLLTMIANVKLSPGQSAEYTLENNIFCDSGAFKALAKIVLQQYGNQFMIADRNNCYFFRLPDEERVAFWILNFTENGKNFGHTHMGLEEYRRRVAPTDSFIANPEFAVFATMDADKIEKFPMDSLYSNQIELDFPRLFATNPEVVRRGIGLQPGEFADFHFHHPDPTE